MPNSISEKDEFQINEPEIKTNIDDTSESLQNHLEKLTEAVEEKNSTHEAEISEEMNQILMPELQGFEILKEGIYVVNPEETISNMLEVVKKMEAQLHSALGLNSDMEKDLDDSKEMIIDLRAEKKELENTIKRMHDKIPSKRELQREIEYLIDERNSAQRKIIDLKKIIKQKEKDMEQFKGIISDLEEDKKNYKVETDYLAKKLNTVLEKSRSHITEIKEPNQEILADIDKIKTLEQELNKIDEKRYKIYKELSK